MTGRGAYFLLGYFLLPSGAILAPVSYFVLDLPSLTALGISIMVLGFTCLALAHSLPPISSEASAACFQAGIENMSALIEELGLSAKAIYLPASFRDGKTQALIPLLPDAALQLKGKLPGRLIVRYGSNPQDMGIAVTTLGGVSLGKLGIKPGASEKDMENALSHLLVGSLDLATSVQATARDGGVEVTVSNCKLHSDNVWFYRCLGSPLASIVATVVAEALDKPVTIKSEEVHGHNARIELVVVD